MTDRIAPVAVAGGAANGAHLHLILGARRQAPHGTGFRIKVAIPACLGQLAVAGGTIETHGVAHRFNLGW